MPLEIDYTNVTPTKEELVQALVDHEFARLCAAETQAKYHGTPADLARVYAYKRALKTANIKDGE